ncbi:hypothetical protein E2C01_067645 [Portunus trituberculatus]|uniref:Uncharacterized protein n=1 Tax=Portunus trituberculatus TaxID=210409 RepID=A0A5B7HKC6_PORTR|nr:hypothetical protein [Portunus trituberculatus]
MPKKSLPFTLSLKMAAGPRRVFAFTNGFPRPLHNECNNGFRLKHLLLRSQKLRLLLILKRRCNTSRRELQIGATEEIKYFILGSLTRTLPVFINLRCSITKHIVQN